MLCSEEWRLGLSPTERDIYIMLKYKFVGTNNGEIILHYSELSDMYSSATIAKAFKGLEAKGWVQRTHYGGMFRYTNKYALTGKYDDWIR